MIDQDDVAARHAHRAYRHAVRAVQRGQADQERERIRRAPLHVHDGLLEQGVNGLLDRGQAHGLAVPRVGVGGSAGERAGDLLDDDDVARGQVQRPRPRRGGAGPVRAGLVRAGSVSRRGLGGPRVGQRGRRGADGQAALPVAPGPEVHFALRGVDHHLGGDDRLEDQVGARVGGAQVGLEQGRPARCGGQARGGDEADIALSEGHRPGAGQFHADPGPGVAAVVQPVADERQVAAHRDPQPGGLQVRLGARGVLVVAQLVTHPGEQLHDRHADVRLMGFRPRRHDQGQPVHQQLPEAGEVLGQVGQVRLGQDLRRAGRRGGAVKPGLAAGHEREADAGVARIHPGQRDIGRASLRVRLDQAQLVARGVARLAHRHLDAVVDLRVIVGAQPDRERGDPGHPLAAGDRDVAGTEPGRGLGQEADGQRAVIVAHLDVVQAVAASPPDELPAQFVAADQAALGRHAGVPGVKVACWAEPVARTT